MFDTNTTVLLGVNPSATLVIIATKAIELIMIANTARINKIKIGIFFSDDLSSSVTENTIIAITAISIALKSNNKFLSSRILLSEKSIEIRYTRSVTRTKGVNIVAITGAILLVIVGNKRIRKYDTIGAATPPVMTIY